MSRSIMTEMTKKVLAESLKKLMAVKPMNKITVKDISDNCKLTRQTFYYHFQDIYELVDWMYRNDTAELLKNCSWEDGILNLMRYIEKNKHMFQTTLESVGREHWEKFFYPDLYEFNKTAIDEIAENMSVSENYIEFIANLYTIILVGLIVQWMEKGMKEEPENISMMLSNTIFKGTSSMLEQCETTQTS